MSNDIDNNFSGHNEFSDEAQKTDSFHGQGGYIEVNKKNYAWGLFWDIPHVNFVDEKLSKRKIAKQARDAASHTGADLFLVTEHQYALGSTEHGHSRGMKTVATSLMDRWGDSFLAAFEIDGAYYLIAVNEGIVLPGSDIRTEYEHEAMQFISEKISSDNSEEWARIIAPASFNILNSTEEDLASIIRSSRSRIRLKDATSKNLLKRVAIISILGAGLYGGYWAYNAYSEHKAQVEAEARRIRLNNLAVQSKLRAQELARQETWPWDNKPIGQYALIACQSAMSNTSIILPGYTFEKMYCDPNNGSVTVSFTQTFGSYATVSDMVNIMTAMKPHITHNGKNIAVIYDYAPLFKQYMFTKHNEYGDVQNEWAWLDRTLDLYRISEFVKMGLTTPPKTDPKQQKKNSGMINNMSGQSDKDIDHIVYKSLSISIDSLFEPNEWIKYLEPLKAFVLDGVTLTTSGGNNSSSSNNSKDNGINYHWSFSGKAYEAIWQSNIDNSSAPLKEIKTSVTGTKTESKHSKATKNSNNVSINTNTASNNGSPLVAPNGLIGGDNVEYKNMTPDFVPRRSEIKVAPVPFNPNQKGPVRENQ